MKTLGKGCLVVVGLLVALGVIGALVGGRAAGGATGAAPAGIQGAAAPTTAMQPAPKRYAVGDDVRVDDVRWKILEATDLGSTLKSSNTYVKDLKTPGRFVRVRFEVENLSKDMLTYAGLDLVDGQGRTFKSSSDAIQFIPQEELCILANLNPNVAKTCTDIYEVPASASGLQARAGDLKILGAASALIDLGLAGR